MKSAVSPLSGVHKMTRSTQIVILNKNLISDFKYDIVLIVLESAKVAERIFEWKGPPQCCAILDVTFFDFEAEIWEYNRD